MPMHYTGELILQPLLCSSGGRCYVIIHCHFPRFRNALCNAVLRGIRLTLWNRWNGRAWSGTDRTGRTSSGSLLSDGYMVLSWLSIFGLMEVELMVYLHVKLLGQQWSEAESGHMAPSPPLWSPRSLFGAISRYWDYRWFLSRDKMQAIEDTLSTVIMCPVVLVCGEMMLEIEVHENCSGAWVYRDLSEH